MLHWLSCHLFRAHDYAVRCENGGVFLECEDCGRRSTGWHTGPIVIPPPAEQTDRFRTRLERLRSGIAGLGVIDRLRRV